MLAQDSCTAASQLALSPQVSGKRLMDLAGSVLNPATDAEVVLHPVTEVPFKSLV